MRVRTCTYPSYPCNEAKAILQRLKRPIISVLSPQSMIAVLSVLSSPMLHTSASVCRFVNSPVSMSSKSVHRITELLKGRAQPSKKEWWERYLKNKIEFYGVPMEEIRSITKDCVDKRVCCYPKADSLGIVPETHCGAEVLCCAHFSESCQHECQRP